MVREYRFPVVGIGASEGGLEAIEAFFSNMPSETDYGVAYVVVHHSASCQQSNIAGVIRQNTSLPVYEIEDGMRVEPNCVYVCPPKQELTCQQGLLYLRELDSSLGANMLIDTFFRSLAHDQQERSICVILSGTGTDGTLGLVAIKGENGMVMAQRPDSAEHNSMPLSAIATSLVDFVLRPDEMADQLVSYVRHFGVLPSQEHNPEGEEFLGEIFGLIRAVTGHDFSQYRRSAIYRRIDRRLAIRKVQSTYDYIDYLGKNPQEVESLANDFMIGVTRFFRDEEAFDVVREKVIPEIVNTKKPGDPIRVWVPGCSTGEEAYSIAICFKEFMDATKQYRKIQIFGTDINSIAIEHARSGIYPSNIAADVPDILLERYFEDTLDGTGYRIQAAIRNMVIFAEQSITQDPPFSRMDLVSCRNLLIYFETEMQKRALHMINYSLVPAGFLFLGSSEALGTVANSFAVTDAKWKVFKKSGSLHHLYSEDLRTSVIQEEATQWRPFYGNKEGKVSIQQGVEDMLLQQYAPPCAVVNKNGEILYLHGRTGRYLEPSPGSPRMNILQMARKGLRPELDLALAKVLTQKEVLYYAGLRVKGDDVDSQLNLTVRPLVAKTENQQDLILVIFEESKCPSELIDNRVEEETAASNEGSLHPDDRYFALERQLQYKEKHFLSVVEELEANIVEHQSAKEEYQSTNEELETSKEELQSINEELVTVNYELRTSIEELNLANNDIKNMLAGTGVGTLFVDLKLRVKRFTPPICEVFNLIQSDVGRPLSHVSCNFEDSRSIMDDVLSVLETLEPKELEAHIRQEKYYLMRIIPYRTLGGVVEGVAITTVDITAQKNQQKKIERLAIVVRDSNDAVTVSELNGRIVAWNRKAEVMYGWSEAEALAMTFQDMIPTTTSNDALITLADLAQRSLEPFEMQRLCKGGRVVQVWMTASVLMSIEGVPYAVATTERLV